MVINIIKNAPYFLEVRVTDIKGAGVENLSVEFEIIYTSNNQTIISGIMHGIGKGVYYTNITLTAVGQYRVLYNLEEHYADSIETIIVEESIHDKVSSILDKLDRIQKILGINSTNAINDTTNFTCLYKRDPDIFNYQYSKLLINNWVLIKVEGNTYHFRKQFV